VGVGDYGVLSIEFRNCDDGAATEEKMCRGGVGVLYGEQRRRSVIMGNGKGICGRAGGGRRESESVGGLAR
jgi:hypothetical protein